MKRSLALWLVLCLSSVAPAQQGLRTRKSKDTIVKANTSKEIAEAVGTRIQNYCGEFQTFYDALGLEKKSDNALVARLFDTREEYEQQYKRTMGDDDPPLAYFAPSLNAIVLYNDEADVTLRQTLFHESSHQFLSHYTADAPKWLNEGMAEYFEGWRMAPDGKLLEKRPNLYDLKLLQDCLKSGKSLAPHALATFAPEEFKDFKKLHPELHPYLHYVTAWGMVYFSLELSSDPSDRARIVDYLKALNTKGPRATFAMDDWNAFEARWKDALLALEAKPVDAVDDVLLAGGYRANREWDKARELYQAAFEADPKFPGVLYWLGFCSKRMGDYEGALKWFEQARSAEPASAMVPYQMARIVLGIDQKDGKGDPAKALVLAETAAKLSGGGSPAYLELVARCQAKGGDTGAALKTIKAILKDVEEDAEKTYYEALAAELKGK